MATQTVNPTPETTVIDPTKPKRGRPKSPMNAMVVSEAKPPVTLALATSPEIVLEEAARAAKALSNAIDSSPAPPVVIRGQRYLRFEHWQTVGRFYGVTAKETSSSYVEHGTKKGYEASADALLVATNQVIGHADSQCMDDEPEWARKPSFQVRSMAQTRACSKALRSIFSWVVVLAGYNPTPAEEMLAQENAEAGNGHVPVLPQQSLPQANDQKLVEGIKQSIQEAKSMEDLIARNKVAFRMGEKAGNPDWVHGKLKEFRDAKKKEFSNAKN